MKIYLDYRDMADICCMITKREVVYIYMRNLMRIEPIHVSCYLYKVYD